MPSNMGVHDTLKATYICEMFNYHRMALLLDFWQALLSIKCYGLHSNRDKFQHVTLKATSKCDKSSCLDIFFWLALWWQLLQALL